MGGAQPAGAQGRGQQVGGGDGILDRQVDPHPADGGHGVGGVADTEQAGVIPAAQAIDPDPEQLDRFPIGQFADPVGERRRNAGNFGAQRLQPPLPQRFEGSLGNHEAALPVVSPLDLDEDAAAVEAAGGLRRIAGPSGEPEPEHVHGGAKFKDLQAGALAHQRMPAVGADHQLGADLQRAVGGGRLQPDHPSRLLDQPGGLGLHAQAEGRIAGAVFGEEAQKIPLGHEGDEPATGRQMGEVGDGQRQSADLGVEPRRLLVGEPEQSLQQSQLLHELQRRGVDGVAAEVAQKVGVLLQQQHLHPGAGQQQSEHHPGRTTAGDAAIHSNPFRRHGCSWYGRPLALMSRPKDAA